MKPRHLNARVRNRRGKSEEQRIIAKHAAEMAVGVELERRYGSQAYWSGQYRKASFQKAER